MTTNELLAEQLQTTRDWTLNLIRDLDEADWAVQPAPGLGHPLFLCGHLAVAQNLLVHVRCLGKSVVPDSFAEHFAIGKPVRSTREWSYPARELVLSTMRDVHEKTLAAVLRMDDALFAEPAFAGDGKPHPYYRTKCGAVSHCIRHEAFHAGQIATIRRLAGKPFLR